MKTTLLATLLALAATTAARAANPPAPCASPEHRQFDFWIGDWEVTGANGKVAGRNRITREYNGCVIHEHYTTDRNYNGESFNVYDASRRVWHQTWVDDSGLLLTLEGRWNGKSLVLEGQGPDAKGVLRKQRITWTPNADGSVRQLWESANDDGSWKVAFDGRYVRKPAAALAASPADEIAAAQSRLAAGLEAGDAKLLEPLIADPFTWVHGSDGRRDDRRTWLASAARGMALSGQRNPRSEYDVTLTTHGDPAHTALRMSRVRLEFPNRESWLRQTHTWVRDAAGAWKLAMGQGVIMYDGPRLDVALHSRYAGTFELEDGRKLVLRWQEPLLLATLPNGAEAQVFLASPTEEFVRTPAAGGLRFTLDERGIPKQVALVRASEQVWRANRVD